MKSFYQVLFKCNPDIQSLKVFGIVVYPLLRPFNENKLQPRSIQHVFLGFAPGYKKVLCYNIQTKKFIISKSVIHDEDVFPFNQVYEPREIQKSSGPSVVVHINVPRRVSQYSSDN